MYFQNIELFETDKFQYLLIHKNGSTSVVKCMEDLNYHVTTDVNFKKVKWTVIRDPYERFLAGLKYDLLRQGLELKDINQDNLYQSLINLKTRGPGDVNHTASQVPYLINTHIDWYVDSKDLHAFLKMHFNKVEYQNVSLTTLELNINKQEVMKHLQLDYYVYDIIKNSSSLWRWQNGKIF
tara:strand:- start:90 stop:632 length:543 start_codon:yes stop_codon:yes gene_type:complete